MCYIMTESNQLNRTYVFSALLSGKKSTFLRNNFQNGYENKGMFYKFILLRAARKMLGSLYCLHH